MTPRDNFLKKKPPRELVQKSPMPSLWFPARAYGARVHETTPVAGAWFAQHGSARNGVHGKCGMGRMYAGVCGSNARVW